MASGSHCRARPSALPAQPGSVLRFSPWTQAGRLVEANSEATQALSGVLSLPPLARVWPVAGGPAVLAVPVQGEQQARGGLAAAQHVPVRGGQRARGGLAAQHVPVRGGQRARGVPAAQYVPVPVEQRARGVPALSHVPVRDEPRSRDVLAVQVFRADPDEQRFPAAPAASVAGPLRARQAGPARSLTRAVIVPRPRGGPPGRGMPSEEVWPLRLQWDAPGLPMRTAADSKPPAA